MQDSFLSSFTPSLMSPQNLEAIFVQREELIKDLMASVKESATTKNKHYRLLIGMRGIGKTHTIALLYHRLRNEADLQDKLIIAWLKEEEWGVSSWLDLQIRIFQALGNSYPEEYRNRLAADVEALYQLSPQEATARGEIILKKFSGDRTLLILTENFDEILKGLGDTGQKKFRAYLQNKSFITIIATAQNLSNDLKSRKRAFYGFFNTNNLNKLSLNEVIDLLTKIAQLQKDSELTKFIKSQTGRDRIKAIHHLAGGNHRVYIIFSQFLTRDSLDDLVKPVMQTLNELTPYYQARMQWLSPQQRKIVELLCDRRHAVPVKEIAQRCFISHQTASSQLKDLLNKGYVVKQTQGRESFYELLEPLMRICLETKKQRGEPIKLFVDFLRIWYTKPGLENRLKTLPENSLEREYIIKALEEQRLLIKTNTDNQLDSKFYILMDKARDSFIDKDFDMALGYSIQAIENNPRNYQGWFFAGFVCDTLELYEDAIDYLNTSIEIKSDYDRCWITLGHALEELENYDEALECYDEAIDINPNSPFAWSSRGHVLTLMFRYEEALESYEKSSEIDPFEDKLWILYAQSLYEFQKFKKSAQSYEQAIKLNGNNEIAWTGYALSLSHIGKYKEAIRALNSAIELNSTDSFLFHTLGEILIEINQWDEGFIALEKSLKLISCEDSEESCWWRIDKVIEFVFKTKKQSEWIFIIRNTVQLYCGYDANTVLIPAIIENIPNLLSDMVSNKAARTWLEVWQEVAGDKPELEIALRFLKTAVEYKETGGDSKVLLKLPKEERDLFETLLEEVEE